MNLAMSSARICPPPPAHFHTVGQLFADKVDAQRLQQKRTQIFRQILAGLALENRRQHVGTDTVVLEHRAGLILEIVRQEHALPILALGAQAGRLGLVTAAHGQQAVNIRLQQILARGFPAEYPGENIAKLIGELERTLLARQSRWRSPSTSW